MINTQKCIKTYTLKLAFIEIAVKEWGDINGQPMIAIHGWLDNMASFYPLINCSNWLETNKIRLITIDLAGHGYSGHRHQSQHYNLLDNVQDLYEILEVLKLEKVSFLAHSMGSAIATLFTSTFPERVTRMISLEMLSPVTQEAEEGPAQLAKGIKARCGYLENGGTAVEKTYKDIDVVIKARKWGTELTDKNVNLLIQRSMKKNSAGYRWRSDPKLRLASLLRLTPQQGMAFINNLSVPVLLLYGEEGFVKKYPKMSKMIINFEHIDYLELKGGHHLHMEHPEPVALAITNYLTN